MAVFSPPETLNEPHFNINPRSTARWNSLAYTQSPSLPSRDSRLQPRKPGTNWLIAVVPAPSLSQEPQLHAHTLSTSPPGRFTDGILIPLFPSLYAQLAAIAREYNMPSTVGLCVYLQTPHVGIMTTPRISDESWPLLWSHLAENDFSQTPLPGLPIAGRIEFDVDHRKGRWLDTWLGTNRKVSIDFNSTLRPPWQLRDEGKTDRPNGAFEAPSLDAQGERESSPTEQMPLSRKASPPQPRGHLRRLSLRHSVDVGLSASSSARPAVMNLSTIVSPDPQGDGPALKSKQELTERVKSWREGSIVDPAIQQAEQTKANANSQQELSSPHSAGERKVNGFQDDVDTHPEMDLDDFSWSISSLGPRSYLQSPSDLASPLLSVHIPDRLAGSVCLTPTTATSFGPDDKTYDEDLPSVSRLPSPDIAYRVIEDSPYTPTTATSWGAPSLAGSFEDVEIETQSIDLACRCAGSVPATPVEEASHIDLWKLSPWGLIWPYNKVQKTYPGPSLWLGNQGPSLDPELNTAKGDRFGYLGYLDYSRFSGNAPLPTSRNEFSAIDAWKLSPWGPIWPYKQQYQVAESDWSYNPSRGSIILPATSACWLYNRARGSTSKHLGNQEAHNDCSTINSQGGDRPDTQQFEGPNTMSQSIIRPSPTNGYSDYAKFLEGSSISSLTDSALKLDAWKLSPWGPIWPIVSSKCLYSWPYNPSRGAITHRTSSMEWPYFVPRGALTGARSTTVLVTTNFAYDNDGYESRNAPSLARVTRSFPYYDAWKMTPWGLIWPYSTRKDECEARPLRTVQGSASVVLYPTFDLYPAVYPFLELYPIKMSGSNTTACSEDLFEKDYIANSASFAMSPSADQDQFQNLIEYPELCIYPPVSATRKKMNYEEEFEIELVGSAYPTLILYPVVYPHFTLYPSPAGNFGDGRALPQLHSEIKSQGFPKSADVFEGCLEAQQTRVKEVHGEYRNCTTMNQSYPYLVIYEAIYPHLHLYPAPAASTASEHWVPDQMVDRISWTRDSVESHLAYPVMTIYASVYPFVEPYPAVLRLSSISFTQTHILTGEPPYDLQGYRHSYPYLEPYPMLKAANMQRKSHAVLHDAIFKNGYTLTPSSAAVRDESHPRQLDMPLLREVSDPSSLRWSLSSPALNYPNIAPYPPLVNAGGSQAPQKYLTIHLNEETPPQGLSTPDSGRESRSPIQLVFSGGPSVVFERFSSPRVPNPMASTANIYPTIQPPAITPPLC